MKSNLFVRPNLKVFLIAALAIAVLQDLMTNGQSETSILTTWKNKPADADTELRNLLGKLEQDPTPELYERISNCYLKLGDFKNAHLYMRRAEISSDIED